MHLIRAFPAQTGLSGRETIVSRMEEAPAPLTPDQESAVRAATPASCGDAPESAASASVAPTVGSERYFCPAVRAWVEAGGRENGAEFEGEGPCLLPGDSYLGYDFDEWVVFHQRRIQKGSHIAACFEQISEFRGVVAEARARPPLSPRLRPRGV